MKSVIVRNNGMGWFVLRNKKNEPAHRAKAGDRFAPWQGSAASTLIAFLNGLLAEAEQYAPSGLDEFHPDTTLNP